ncbi:hypothetical protein F4778DRAFT_283300 [Xylariomycetidae sp. FL2044]|nr:hypothetical protein F4778DRAFT_283300 [Xylariomycetidae sp. FL2044]
MVSRHRRRSLVRLKVPIYSRVPSSLLFHLLLLLFGQGPSGLCPRHGLCVTTGISCQRRYLTGQCLTPQCTGHRDPIREAQGFPPEKYGDGFGALGSPTRVQDARANTFAPCIPDYLGSDRLTRRRAKGHCLFEDPSSFGCRSWHLPYMCLPTHPGCFEGSRGCSVGVTGVFWTPHRPRCLDSEIPYMKWWHSVVRSVEHALPIEKLIGHRVKCVSSTRSITV